MASRLGGLLEIVGSGKKSKARPETDANKTRLDPLPAGKGAEQQAVNLQKPEKSVCRGDAPGNLQTGVEKPDDDSDYIATPDELESSRPPTPEPTAVRQRWNDPRINIFRVATACVIQFGQGMNDSAPGALLPYIEQHYHIDYTIVSMIFICNAAGFIAAAFWVHALDRKIGRGRIEMCNEALDIVGYTIQAVAPPFPAFAISYFLTGIGLATNLALNNVFVANLANSNGPLGTFHGCYGLGGVVAPIFATAMVSHGIPFQRFFLIMLSLRVITFFASGYAFWNFERDNALPQEQSTKATDEVGSHDNAKKSSKRKAGTLVQSLRNKNTLVGALFIFAYQGAEVTISGWVISFLITTRGGDPARVGYVTAGFWGGITFGRFVVNMLSTKLGERLFGYLLITCTAAFQFVVWFAPNVPADAVATAMLGVLLGPIYPCATRVFTRLLPRGLQNSSLAFISSAGSSGGALAPFITGIISQSKGTYVLNPICIALYVVMVGCWAFLTKGFERRKNY